MVFLADGVRTHHATVGVGSSNGDPLSPCTPPAVNPSTIVYFDANKRAPSYPTQVPYVVDNTLQLTPWVQRCDGSFEYRGLTLEELKVFVAALREVNTSIKAGWNFVDVCEKWSGLFFALFGVPIEDGKSQKWGGGVWCNRFSSAVNEAILKDPNHKNTLRSYLPRINNMRKDMLEWPELYQEMVGDEDKGTVAEIAGVMTPAKFLLFMRRLNSGLVTRINPAKNRREHVCDLEETATWLSYSDFHAWELAANWLQKVQYVSLTGQGPATKESSVACNALVSAERKKHKANENRRALALRYVVVHTQYYIYLYEMQNAFVGRTLGKLSPRNSLLMTGQTCLTFV